MLSVMESPLQLEEQRSCASCSLSNCGLIYSAYSHGAGNQADRCNVCQLRWSSSEKVPILSVTTRIYGF